jgi:hypothetical protein
VLVWVIMAVMFSFIRFKTKNNRLLSSFFIIFMNCTAFTLNYALTSLINLEEPCFI